MKNKTIWVVMILMFGVALGAGVVAGKLSAQLPGPSAEGPDQGSLTDILHLNPDQRSRMQAIWEGVRKTSDDCLDDANTAQKDQDAKIKALLNPEEFGQYSKLTMEFQQKIGELTKKRQSAFNKAVNDSLQLMTPEQQKLYNQIVQDRVGKTPGASLQESSS